MLRSLGAVVAGYLSFAVPAVALFAVTGRDSHAAQPLAFMVGSTLYGMLFAALGGYVAARLAGRHPLRHAIVLSLVIALGAAVSIVTRSTGDTVWSQLAALFLMAPSGTLGGLLRRN
jgi:MFS-type transporter involved in bile tolerance (Atg22 family)